MCGVSLVALFTTGAKVAYAAGVAAAQSGTSGLRINPTSREIQISVPVLDGEASAGDLLVTVTPDDTILVPVGPLLDLLQGVISDSAASGVRSKFDDGESASLEQLAEAGLPISFDPDSTALRLELASGERGETAISLGGSPDRRFAANAIRPDWFSAYINYNARIDFVHEGTETGLLAPNVVFDTAINLFGVVTENELQYIGGDTNRKFQRFASRIVYDIPEWTLRFRLGDITPQGRRFQSGGDILGGSIERIYADTQPSRNIRSGGFESFVLDQESDVDIFVNGVLVDRRKLQPGNYSLQDFAFGTGGSNVVVVAEDRFGRRELLNASTFLDDGVIDPGVLEFSLSGGVRSSFINGERVYDEEGWFVTGYARYGLTGSLTIGVNGQADRSGRLYGADAVWATSIGSFAIDVAYSDLEALGSGYAGRLAYSRSFGGKAAGRFTVNASALYRSEQFGPPGSSLSGLLNSARLQINGNLNYQVTDDIGFSLSADYLEDRDGVGNSWSVSGGVSWDVTESIGTNIGLVYSRDDDEGRFGVRASISARFGPTEFVQASYETRSRTTSINYFRTFQDGADDYAISGSLGDFPSATNASVGASYRGNRIFASFDHSTTYSKDTGDVSDSRSSLSASGAIAFTGGQFAVGNSVGDSFAIIDAHESLGEAEVYIDYNDKTGDYENRTDWLGPALVTSVGSHVPRTIRITVPDAPVGYDLGDGTFSLAPGYKSGFDLEVGSEFTVTAVGSLSRGGVPVELTPGVAVMIDDPDSRQVEVFTNQSGNFAASGLKPGRWRITLATDPPSTFDLVVPDRAIGFVRLGNVEAN